MKIGMSELLVVFIVALFVLGPDKLPYYAKKLGEALSQFRKYSDEATRDIKESIVEPLNEAQKPLKEAMEPVKELDEAIRGNAKDIQDSFASIGKENKEKGRTQHETGDTGTDHHSVGGSDPLRTDADPEADEDVREEREGIPRGDEL